MTQRVILASYPRSGNTFVRQVLLEAWGVQTFTTYPNEWQTQHLGPCFDRVDLSQLPVAFIKTHRSDLNKRCDLSQDLVWHIVRDGRDAVTSYRKWEQAPNDMTPGNWSECVLELDRFANHTTRYEDLIVNPIGEVRAAIASLGLSELLPQQSNTLTPFAELHQKDPAFYRAGRVGDWKTEMADWQEFESEHAAALERFWYPLTKEHVTA